MSETLAIEAIAGLTIINIVLRHGSFLLPQKLLNSQFAQYISRLLPAGIITLLVCYCLYEASPDLDKGLWVVTCGGLVAMLQIFFSNSLLSIGLGSALYLFICNSGIL